MKKGFILPLLIIILAAVAFFWFRNSDISPSPTATSTNVSTKIATSSTISNDKNPLLNPAQEQTLEKFGIDPASLPKTLTPAMITCAKEKLGEVRANELLEGATPSISDFYKARSCF